MRKFKIFILAVILPFIVSCQALDEVKKQVTLIKKQVMELIGLESKSASKKKKKKKKEAEPAEQAETQPANQAQPSETQPPSTPPSEGGSVVPSEPGAQVPPVEPGVPSIPPPPPPPAVTDPYAPVQTVAPEVMPPVQGLPGQPGQPTQATVPQPPVGEAPVGAPGQAGQAAAEAPKPASPDEGLPLKRIMQVGGEALWVKADSRFTYVAFGRSVGVWDSQLNPRGVIPLEAKPLNITSIPKNQDTYLYIKEEGNILEIVKIPALGPAQFVKGFQVDGPFDGAYTRVGTTTPSQDHLFVFLADRMQILDVTNPENIQVISEPNIADALQVLMSGTYAYVLKPGSLVVLDASNYSILGTVPLEGTYGLLGVRKGLDKNRIVLAKLDPTGAYQAFRFVSVQVQGGSVSDLGTDMPLPRAYSQLKLDEATGYLLGLSEGIPYIYDTASNSELVLKGPVFQGVSSAVFQDSGLLALSKDKLKRYDWKLNTALSAEAAPAAREITLSGERKALWPVGIGKFIIPSQYQLMLFASSGEAANFFETSNFKANLLKPYSLAGLSDVKRIRMGLVGVYFLDGKSSKVFLRKWDGSFSELAPLSALKFTDIDVAVGGEGDTLVGIAPSKTKAKEEAVISSYLIGKTTAPQKKASFTTPFASSFRIFSQGQRAALACATEGLCLVDLKAPAPAAEKGLARGQALTATRVKTHVEAPEASVSAVVVAPDEKKALAYYTSANGSFLSIIDLAANTETAVVPLLNVSASQFEGLSFAQGGKRALIPGDEGLIVYELKDIKNPALLFKWPVGRAEQADVTNRGQTFCVSLGDKGLECADFQAETPPKPEAEALQPAPQ